MNIAACYIVRNEATNLRRSIASLRECYNQLLVIDTGSQDATVKTAQDLGAVVRHFAWCDDFAAARNFALGELSRLTPDTDWVIFLDADEYFSAETAGNIRNVITRAETAGKSALLVSRVSLETATGEVLSEEPNLRIFALRPGRRYMGRIHEELRDGGQPLDGLALVPRGELLLYHTGYAREVNRPKAERNLRILQQELQEAQKLATPEERQAAAGRLYMYLAEACRGVDDMDAALRYARLDIAQGRRNVVFASRSYHLALGVIARKLEQTEGLRQYELLEARLRLARQAVQDFPELPELAAEYGGALLSVGELAAAGQALERALAIHQPANSLEPRQFTAAQREQVQQLLMHIRQAQQRQVFITAGLICQDEAAVLPDWLADAQQFADEIVVGDTGSGDGSADLVRAAGAKVLDLSLGNAADFDFAAAKNAVLAAAAAVPEAEHWYVFLDADERFYHPERVRGLLQLLPESVQGVQVPLINIDVDRLGEEIDRVPLLRLWRAQAGRHFVGRVHEAVYDVQPDGSTNVVPAQTLQPALAVCHTGYASSRAVAKAKRNLVLLEADIKAHGEQPRHWRYLASTCYGLAEYELAAHYAELAIKRGPEFVAGQREMYSVWLSSLRLAGRPEAERIAAARSALEAYPQEAGYQQEMDRLEAFQSFDDWYAGAGSGDSLAKKLSERWAGLGQADREHLMSWARERGHWDVQAALAALEDGPDIPASHIVQLAAAGGREQVTSELPQAFGQVLRELFAALYYQIPVAEADREAWLVASDVLPEPLQRVLLRAAGSSQALTGGHFDAWQSGLMALAQGSNGILPDWTRYAGLAVDFAPDWALVERAAAELQGKRAFAAAFELLGCVPVAAADGEFWYRAGVSLYHLRQSGAAECFARAAEAGCRERSLAAYQAWSAEGRA